MFGRKLILPLSLSVAGACHAHPDAKQPEVATIEISRDMPTLSPVEAGTKDVRAEKVEAVTERVRQQMRGNCYWSFEEPYRSCSKNELEIYFEMVDKVDTVSPQARRNCMPDGDYERGCIEEAYGRLIGKDALYHNLVETRNRCEAFMQQCVEDKIAACRKNGERLGDCADSERRMLLKKRKRLLIQP